MAEVHVRYEGQSVDITFNQLDIGPLSEDRAIKAALAGYLDVPEQKFSSFVVDRNTSTGDITVRPQAVFG
jgi:hypothetical protein